MTSIDELSAESELHHRQDRRRPHGDLPARARSGPSAATPSSPSTTTSSSRPTPSRDACRKKFADRAPRVVDTDDGGQTWMYDGQSLPNVGFNAVVGRPVSEYGFEPARFDEMRRGAWDIHARVKDMDLNGVYASLNFPSFLPGFAGQRLQQVTTDRDLAMASVQGVERLAHRGVGRRLPRPDHPVPAAVAARSRGRREDDLRERRTRIPRGDVQREPGDAGTADDPLGLLGSAHGGLRGDRNGGEPAHRLVGHVAVDHRRRTARRAGRAVLRLRHHAPRSTGCTRVSAPGTRTSRSACPRAESAGWQDFSIASTTC